MCIRDRDDAGASTTATISNLGPGTYTVTVTDANSCTTTTSATVNEPDALVLTPSDFDLSCNGDADGSVSVSVSGGTAGYTYAWEDSNDQFVSTDPTVLGLGAGVYDVTVTDANGCFAITNATINEPTLLTLSATTTDVTCNGNADGSITTIVSGGTAGYTYVWSTTDGSGLVAGAANQTALGGGTYELLVTDANDCEESGTYVINELSGANAGEAIDPFDELHTTADFCSDVTTVDLTTLLDGTQDDDGTWVLVLSLIHISEPTRPY